MRVLLVAILTVYIIFIMSAEYVEKAEREVTDRAGRTHVLSKLLAGLESNQGSWGTSVVRPRLNINGGGTVVDDNGLVGGGGATDHGGESGEDAELHVGEYLW